jgi:hypothetical protein
MSSIKTIINVFRSKSLRYILFRAWFTFEQKSGLLRKKFPTRMKPVRTLSLEEWRKQARGYFFDSKDSIKIIKKKDAWFSEAMSHILKGDVLFFSKTWKPLGLDYDWVTNPETGFKYDIHQHWTKIESMSKEAGDIKFTWEKSRFSWLLTVCRYDYHFDEDHSEFVINQILDWIEKNPLNCGPNYKCSQETSLRLNNWIFALHFYKHSEALTENNWNKIITSIYWQIHHVYQNINYSRIAVRNNHAITETLTLYLMGLMFPEMPGAIKWKRNGKRWFEREIDYQIEDDGTYIQDSMNYHRVVIQLLTYGIAIADAHDEKFSDMVYEKAYKSLNFLYQCQETTNGWLPNYGSNDGALFFPLSTADYRDYRPQLDALHGLLTGLPLYGDAFLEDAQWIKTTVPADRKLYSKLEKTVGAVSFKNSGYYVIRDNNNTMTFIRCGLFKNNGSTDQLHVDIWYKGRNILMDCGSYMYNTKEELVKYFRGTESHNTVMLGDKDQMMKGPRFMWFFPPTIISSQLNETYFEFSFEGKINAFKHVGENIIISRTIKKQKGVLEWKIVDEITGAPDDVVRRQLWHTDFNHNDNFNLNIESDGERIEKEEWASDYYGEKRKITQVEFQSKGNRIETTIKIKN